MIRRLGLLVTLALFFGTGAAGQESDPSRMEPPDTLDPSEHFRVEDLESRTLEELPIEIHGRFDWTWVGFSDSRNVDGFKKRESFSTAPALSAFWRPTENLSFIGELEFDGRDGKIELDQLLIRKELPAAHSEFDFGINYVPFGIERYYQNPDSNPLIDRPSPFRRIFPGSYSDFGIFYRFERKSSETGRKLKIESAFTRGLRGPRRDDRPDDPLDINDETQISGRIGFELWPGFQIGTSGLLVWFDEGRDRHRRLDLVGIDLTWRSNLASLRMEYVDSGVERAPAEGGDYRRRGFYAEAYRRFPFDLKFLDSVEVAVRYDRLDEDSEVRNFRDVDRIALGLNWVINENLRFKSEFLTSREHHEQIANNGVLFQLEFHF